jgi:hypothetical protein
MRLVTEMAIIMKNNDERSPIVTHLSWGEMVIEGIGSGRDFKLFPGGGCQWDWTKTGTHHRPGIQIADLAELLAYGSEAVVLSRGIQSMLHTCPEVFELLHESGVEVYVTETKSAVGIYNSLATRGRRVGGLFHSTC